MSRKSLYNQDPEFYNSKVEFYRKKGISDKQISHNLGITITTFYVWLKTYPEFSQAYKKGKKVIVEELENYMYKRALGVELEDVTQEVKSDGNGNVIEKHVKKTKRQIAGDPTTAIFLLTNLNKDFKRNPDYNQYDRSTETIDFEFEVIEEEK